MTVSRDLFMAPHMVNGRAHSTLRFFATFCLFILIGWSLYSCNNALSLKSFTKRITLKSSC